MAAAPADCQVLVVGAGPAGGDLARSLACHGVSVLLVDQLDDLRRAAFSSAAMPLAAVEQFALPASVVASRWSGWRLIGPGEHRRDWQADAPLGVVLDFAALRLWLAGECRRWGGQMRLGLRALGCEREGERMLTRLRDRNGVEQRVLSDWVIDASGQGRSLLEPGGRPAQAAEPLVSGIGVEWLLRVEERCWWQWADRLSFCLGSDWIPQGYGWVFPMQPGVLKLGVCRLHDPERPQPPLAPLLEHLLERLLGDKGQPSGVSVLDRHGGLIRSRIHRREQHRRGRLVGLGDAVSTANLLGGEGIRHALTSSRVLAPLLIEALKRQSEDPLDRYPSRLNRALGWRWALSGRLARRTWLSLRGPVSDRRLDRLLGGLEKSRAEDLSALLFDYRFERYGLRALPYGLGWR
ncbi:MAG: NAD(P)/FAD-dependent oxidoreductase [Cyanobium sp.]